MSQTGNLYDILGVKRYASIDEVKYAFRRLAVQFHPDKNPGNPAVEEKFKQMVAAYNVLSDEEKKRNYDLRLSGFYTYKKTSAAEKQETEEELKAKRREQVRQMRQKLKEKEEKEINEAYAEAKRKIPYKWRYTIVIVGTLAALFFILDNWFMYDVVGKEDSTFVKVFTGYVFSIAILMFFLNSLFIRWNARNIVKPFSFDIRNRISTFFVLYIFLMINFSFRVPEYYRQFHLSTFGETTTGVLYYEIQISSAVLIYNTPDKKIIKNLGKGYFTELNVNRQYDVIIEYSSASPYISKIKGFNDALEL